MPTETLHVLVVGAHPDDCDLKAGGIACKYADRGHKVLFVSTTNGEAGHHELAGRQLVERRHAEAEASAAVAGVEFEMFDVPDGRLRPSLENRDRLVRRIREFRPDLVLTHRPNDYHPDHRYTSRLVRDAAYLVAVPNVCPATPALDRNPVFAYLSDTFERPYPFSPDVVVDIDDVAGRKFEMLDCHESQMYEWLPSVEGTLEAVPDDPDERFEWLRGGGLPHVEVLADVSDRYRDALVERYGASGEDVRYAEAFEASEYGRALTDEAAERLFPF
ncbi:MULTISPECIES: PIG-L deacetylase family protein [Halorussus]|uniref:PIG-L deacetylase family protein n=1 Tax=Halorussus TaxID=1070314 RepID=UPI0020A04111|nr:PIG-L family deacetylase [Halorussus vallis]USZ78314.1 PIG-L family deacetylase [Halorussus vallis]USZ78338.1 PIG-L family deacetylase [Halorussus vallis]